MKRILSAALLIVVIIGGPAQAQTYYWPACLGGHGPVKCRGLLNPAAFVVTAGMLPTGIPAINIAAGTVTDLVFGYLSGVTGPIQAQLDGKQAASAELSAIAAFAGTGMIAKTGPAAYAGRTITGTAEIVVNNGNGVSGNPGLSMGATLTNKQLTSSNGPSVAYKIVETPGTGANRIRMFVRGNSGWFFTMNASTTDGTTWTKDDTSLPSSVLSFEGTAGAPTLSAKFENSAASSWSTPTRSIRWTGTSSWLIKTGIYQQEAWSGGFIKGCVSGDVVRFPVQWPIPFEATPTNISIGTAASSGVDLTTRTMGVMDNTGGEVRITCNVTGDAYWIAKISAGS